MDITALSADQLRRAASIKEQIDALNSELSSILSGSSLRASAPAVPSPQPSGSPKRRKMSAAGRAAIAAAVRARWAKVHAAQGKTSTAPSSTAVAPKKRRTMSPAARAKIAAAARARWAKVRASKV